MLQQRVKSCNFVSVVQLPVFGWRLAQQQRQQVAAPMRAAQDGRAGAPLASCRQQRQQPAFCSMTRLANPLSLAATWQDSAQLHSPAAWGPQCERRHCGSRGRLACWPRLRRRRHCWPRRRGVNDIQRHLAPRSACQAAGRWGPSGATLWLAELGGPSAAHVSHAPDGPERASAELQVGSNGLVGWLAGWLAGWRVGGPGGPGRARGDGPAPRLARPAGGRARPRRRQGPDQCGGSTRWSHS